MVGGQKLETRFLFVFFVSSWFYFLAVYSFLISEQESGALERYVEIRDFFFEWQFTETTRFQIAQH